MQRGVILNFVSIVLKSMAPLLLIPVIVGYWYGEPTESLYAFLNASLLSVLLGYSMDYLSEKGKASTKEAMMAVGLGWVFACLVGAIPFTGVGLSYLDAVFESVAGFTTTGTTLLLEIRGLPHSVLFWRSFIQWLGGIGIIASFSVLLTGEDNKLLPQIFFAETSKIASQRVTQSAAKMVAVLGAVYLTLTLAEFVALSALGVGAFDAVTHSFTTLSTGGFSTFVGSVAAFDSVAVEAVITVFMFLGGLNFIVIAHYFARKGKVNYETKLYAAIIVAASLLVCADLALNGASLFNSAREGIFQVVSIMTTTGYTTANFIAWPKLSQIILVTLMVIGGCAGSTGGGIKVIRFGLLAKTALREMKKVCSPKLAVNQVRIGREAVSEGVLQGVAALFVLWLGLLLIGGTITAVATNYPVFESFSGMASALGNIGPSLIPASETPLLPNLVKVLFMIGMLAGRLEIIPLVVLFNPASWKGFP